MSSTDTRTIELWIDALNAVWGFDYGRGKLVRAPSCIVKNEYPSATLDISENGPIALSDWDSVDMKYGNASSSIPTILIWHGVTHLHLCADTKPSNLAFTHPFTGRILAAAKANSTLGGLVSYFQLEETGAITQTDFAFMGGTPHDGFVIRWTVKQNLSGQI